jgi:hypothetical protein
VKEGEYGGCISNLCMKIEQRNPLNSSKKKWMRKSDGEGKSN